MNLLTRYHGSSGVELGADGCRVGLATSALRPPVAFKADLVRPLPMREALAVLQRVVWQGLRQHRRAGAPGGATARGTDFARARHAYARWVFEQQREQSVVIDPFVTVHPDALVVEACAPDASTYVRMVAKRGLFVRMEPLQCGTSQVDFPPTLEQQFQKLRGYRSSRLHIGTAGLAVSATARAQKEKRVSLSAAWLHRLHRAQCAIGPAMERTELDALELLNGGANVEAQRRRHVRLLAPLLLGVRKVRAAAVEGLVITELDLGELSLTLVSCAPSNVAGAGTASLHGSAAELLAVYAALAALRSGSALEVARRAGVPLSRAQDALASLCAVGRAMFDLHGGHWRQRDLLVDGLTPDDAAHALGSGDEAPGTTP